MKNTALSILIVSLLAAFCLVGCVPGDRMLLLDVRTKIVDEGGNPLPNENVLIIGPPGYSYSSLQELLEVSASHGGRRASQVSTDSQGCLSYTAMEMESAALLLFIIPININGAPFTDPPIEFALLFPDRNTNGYAFKYSAGKIKCNYIEYQTRRILKDSCSERNPAFAAIIHKPPHQFGDPNKPWSKDIPLADITISLAD